MSKNHQEVIIAQDNLMAMKLWIGPYSDGSGYSLTVEYRGPDPSSDYMVEWCPNGQVQVYSNEHATDPHASIDARYIDDLIETLKTLRSLLPQSFPHVPKHHAKPEPKK